MPGKPCEGFKPSQGFGIKNTHRKKTRTLLENYLDDSMI